MPYPLRIQLAVFAASVFASNSGAWASIDFQKQVVPILEQHTDVYGEVVKEIIAYARDHHAPMTRSFTLFVVNQSPLAWPMAPAAFTFEIKMVITRNGA